MARKRHRVSKHFHVLGYRIRRRTVYLFGAFMFFVCVVYGALIYALMPGRESERPVVELSNEIAATSAEPVTTDELEEILRRHRQAMQLGNVTSLTLHGSYHVGERPYELALSVRAPEMIRRNKRDRQLELVAVANGDVRQIRRTPAMGEVTVRTIDKDHLDWYALVLEGAVFRLAGQRYAEDFSYVLLPREEGETGVRKIESVGPSGVRLTHVIDEASALELKRRVEVLIDDTPQVMQLHLQDYRQIAGGVMLPHRYQLELGDRTQAVMQVDAVQVNPSLTRWFFNLKDDSPN